MPTPLLTTTAADLRRRLAREQVVGRAPSTVAGVVRDGRLVWSDGVGTTGLVPTGTTGPDATTAAATGAADRQYRIGSITKTFTAVLVLQLRDEGRLELDDTVGRHLPGTAVDDRRVAALLAHTAGLAAETAPPWWERTDGTGRDLAAVLGDAPVLAREGAAHHYSNVAYGVLGELVAAVTGRSWREAVQTRLLDPLGMDRTTVRPVAPHATGLAVHPWADLVTPEPEHDAGVLAPAGQLWSTVTDLATWSEVLAGRRPDVLATATAAEMSRLAVVAETPADPAGWTSGHGLGLQLVQDPGRPGRGPRRLAGHTGSMPGFVATLWSSAADGLTAVAMANTTSGFAVSRLVADLIDVVASAEPPPVAAWSPASDVDPDLLAVTGPWYWGPAPFALRLRGGRGLELVTLGGAGRGSRFAPAAAGDTWTGLDGYYRGETLTVRRGRDGRPGWLELASFVFTRTPYDAGAPVPGGPATRWTPSGDAGGA